MKKVRRVFGAVVAALLLIIASVSGTLAYLTSVSEEVKNTFTVGKVAITLDEAKVNDKGQPIKMVPDSENPEQQIEEIVTDLSDADRVRENDYHLYPGHSYTKDPTVTVKAGSDPSYIRIQLTAKFKDLPAILASDSFGENFELSGVFVGHDAALWERHGRNVDAEADTITYEYWYHETVAAPTANVPLAPLFTSIEIPEDWSADQIDLFEDFELTAVAHAIQADGFETADEAWDAFQTATP